MTASVALVLVSHDGARWLPTVIEGVKAQTVPPSRVIMVDTGSKDGSAELLEQAFPSEGERPANTLIRMPGSTPYPAAVREALGHLRDDEPTHWVWLLHDDSTPEPGTLEALLAAAEANPDADALGPKLREWPSLKRLLEVGVTISPTGRRETGLDSGEYDQGQYAQVKTVLAVNTAGMLVRRGLLVKLDGFDPQLPIFGNDIDFGWRAASSGHRTVIVPTAVVFHAEAAHQGLRRTALTGRHTHYQERRAALYTLLANGRPHALWWQLPRLLVGTLIRMVGYLAVRQVGAALDDLAALVSVYSRPRTVLRARRVRQGRQSVPWARVKQLVAPWWLPYRHGLDLLTGIVEAATLQAGDVAERRRIAKAEADPSSFAARRQGTIEALAAAEDDDLPEEGGAVARFLTNPLAVLLTLSVVLSLVATSRVWRSWAPEGFAPTPAHVSAWWRLLTESWHPLWTGTDVPESPSTLFLALPATILGGSPRAAVVAVFALGFVVALASAWRFLRVVGRLLHHRGMSRWLILWGSLAYALVPLASGALGQGRIGAVATAAVLPLAAHAALGFAEPERDRRVRAGWRVGLWLTVMTAFTPTIWAAALVLVLVVLLLIAFVRPGVLRRGSVVLPVLGSLLTPVVLLAHWWVPALRLRLPELLGMDAGAVPGAVASGWDLALGRVQALDGAWAGAPWWLGLAVPALALAALIPGRSRIPVLVCFLVIASAAVTALLASRVAVALPASALGLGVLGPLVLLQGAAVVAVVVGAQSYLASTDRLPKRVSLRRALVHHRTWVASAGLVALLVPVVGGFAWALATLGGTEPPDDASEGEVPAYMTEAAERSLADGVLVLHGSVESGMRYSLLRGDGTTLGEEAVVAFAPVDPVFEGTVDAFVSAPTPEVVQRLAGFGVRYVVLPAPADAVVAAALDASGALDQASTAQRDTRAWQLAVPAADPGLTGHGSWEHRGLLALWLGGLVVLIVLSLPTWQRRRL